MLRLFSPRHKFSLWRKLWLELARAQRDLGLSRISSDAIAQMQAQEANASRDERITPERLGLPKGNTRTSEPFVTRVYKTDDSDQILKPQPKGFPFTGFYDPWSDSWFGDRRSFEELELRVETTGEYGHGEVAHVM